MQRILSESVFISYSHEDVKVAAVLEETLVELGAECFRDVHRIEVADVLPDRIREGVEGSSIFLLIWSVRAAHSEWVEKEWKLALEQSKKIVIYKLDSAPNPSPFLNVVHITPEDQKRSDAELVRAVFGRDYVPSGRVFPGHWQMEVAIPNLGRAIFQVELRRNGQIVGSGKYEAGGVVYPDRASRHVSKQRYPVNGDWTYDARERFLNMKMLAQATNSQPESIRIYVEGGGTHELRVSDEGGRVWVLQRRAGASSLEELLEDVTGRIARLSSDDSSRFAEQMSKAGVNFHFQEVDESIRSAVRLGTASFMIDQIKEIPALAQEIVAEIRKPETRPEVRCSLLASLVCLVQPQDLVPDDAPGGYGFLDDCVLLHAARLAHLTQFPNPDAKRNKRGPVD